MNPKQSTHLHPSLWRGEEYFHCQRLQQCEGNEPSQSQVSHSQLFHFLLNTAPLLLGMNYVLIIKLFSAQWEIIFHHIYNCRQTPHSAGQHYKLGLSVPGTNS